MLDMTLNQAAAMNIVQMDNDYYSRRRHLITQAFAGGLHRALVACPEVQHVYFDQRYGQLKRSVRTLEDVQAYLEPDKYAHAKGLSLQDVELAKRFNKQMIPMRKALGTTGQVREQVEGLFPCRPPQPFSIDRSVLLALCERLMINPWFVLDQTGEATIVADLLDQSSPTASTNIRTPRL